MTDAPPVTQGKNGRTYILQFPDLRDPDWLRAEYVTAGRSLVSIATEQQCTRQTVANALAAAGIPIRARTTTRPDAERTPEQVAAARAEGNRRARATQRALPKFVDIRAQQVESARSLLTSGHPLSPRARLVLEARVAHPDAPAAVLAEVTGMSGGAYRANLWKALQKTPADAEGAGVDAAAEKAPRAERLEPDFPRGSGWVAEERRRVKRVADARARAEAEGAFVEPDPAVDAEMADEYARQADTD